MGIYATDITLDCRDSTGAFDLRQARWPHNGDPGSFQIMDAFIGYGSALPAPPGWLIIGPAHVMRDGRTGAVYDPPPPDRPDEPRSETLNLVMDENPDSPAYDLLIRPVGGGKVELLVFEYDTAPDY